MGISHISKANIGAQLITSISSREPDWSVIPTAGKSSRSQDIIFGDLKELARKAAVATNKSDLEYISRLKLKLRAEYLSDVAPNRKMLYQQAKNVMRNQSGNSKCQGSGELTLLDFLEEADGKIRNLADKEFALAGGGTLSCPMLTGGGYGVEIKVGDTLVLANLGHGWSYGLTSAEIEKMKVFNDIYWDEYRSVKNGKGAELAELPDYLEDKPAFDSRV